MNEAGVPVLFLRISRWVKKSYPSKYDVYVVDYIDGAMARNITSQDSIKLAPVSKSEEPDLRIEDNAIVIMQSLIPSVRWPRKLIFNPKTKIFFWTLHPLNFKPDILPIPGLNEWPFRRPQNYSFISRFYQRYLGRLASLVDSMSEHDAIAFMDITNFEQTKQYIPISVADCNEYLPVPADNYNGPLKKKSISDVIHVCWLGRIEDEKLPALVYIIEQVSKYALENKQKVLFTPLGYGKGTDIVDNINLENNYYSQEKCRVIKMVDINQYLIDNVDLLFGMGTSALEAAKMGVPTCLVDASTESVFKTDYVFKPIYERKGYDLWHLVKDCDCERDNNSLGDIFYSVKYDFDEISSKCRDYFVTHHAIDFVGSKFVTMIDRCSFTYDMMDKNVFKKPLIQSLQLMIHNIKRKNN